jgi:hypothetical protein
MADNTSATPWKNAEQAGQRMGGRSKRFVMKEVNAGRLRAARIGGRRTVLTRDEWIDHWLRVSGVVRADHRLEGV